MARINYRKLVGRDASLRSWGSRQSLEDVRVLLRDVDPTDIAVIIWAGTEIAGALVQIDAWLQDNPDDRDHFDVTQRRVRFITGGAWFDRPNDKDFDDAIRDFQRTRRELSLSIGQFLGPVPAWRADPNHPNTIVLTQAMTALTAAGAQVHNWLQENPFHIDHLLATSKFEELVAHYIGLTVAYDRYDIDDVIDNLHWTLRPLIRWVGPLGDEPLAWYDAGRASLNGLTPQEWLTALRAATTRVLVLAPWIREEARISAGATLTGVITARNAAAVSEGRVPTAALAGWIRAALIDTVAWNLIDDPNAPAAREITPQDRVFVDSLLNDSDVALRQTRELPSDAPSTADEEDSGDSDGEDSGDSDEDSDVDAAGDEPVALRAVGAVSGQVGDEPLGWYNAVQAPLNGLTPQQWLTALGAGTNRVLALPPQVREEARTHAGAAVDAVITGRNNAAVSAGRVVPAAPVARVR
ncbi:MAG: hypothetical protein ACRYF3_08635, partial [Janthinobacterium lividum]